MSARSLPQEPNVQSWLLRMLVLDYYDGPTEGIAECREGHVAIVRMLDWDDGQNVRVFAVYEERDESFGELEALLRESESPRWPVFLPTAPLSGSAQRRIERLLGEAHGEPEYLIASENPVATILACRVYPKGVDSKDHDWLAELGVPRRGMTD